MTFENTVFFRMRFSPNSSYKKLLECILCNDWLSQPLFWEVVPITRTDGLTMCVCVGVSAPNLNLEGKYGRPPVRLPWFVDKFRLRMSVLLRCWEYVVDRYTYCCTPPLPPKRAKTTLKIDGVIL